MVTRSVAQQDYVAAAVLIDVGLYVVLASDQEDTKARFIAGARGWGLIALAFSVSLDELAMGLCSGPYEFLSCPPSFSSRSKRSPYLRPA